MKYPIYITRHRNPRYRGALRKHSIMTVVKA